MQKSIIVILFITFISCTAPKEIIKSNTLLPKCHCEGKGENTLVMDAGMGNWSIMYQPLFQKLKQNHRVCLIDRPGYAMDSVTTHPRNLKTVANEIHQILSKQGVTEDIILVGHSLGGLHVRQYQSLFPNKVKGLILLDAAHSNQFNRLPKDFYIMLQNQPEKLEEVIAIAKKGYLKYGKSKIPTFGLPENLLEEYYSVATEPTYYYAMKEEVEIFEDNLKTAEYLDDIGNLPLLVIGSKNSMDPNILPSESAEFLYKEHNRIWFELQKELADLSTNSTFVASEANHYLNVTDTDLVYNSIIEWLQINFNHEN